MIKVAMIGAGSVVFSKNLTGDILSFPEFRDAAFSYMDIDAERLEVSAALCRKVAAALGANPTITTTRDLRQSLAGADFVINMVQIGGFNSTLVDFEIPRKYGLQFTIADTTGPGGLFRALRTFPMLRDLGRLMTEVCPRAHLLNYSNPMGMNMRSLGATSDVPAVGLCHSVQGTLDQLAGYLGEDPRSIAFTCAGINHMAFYTRLEKDGVDLYPRLFEAMRRPEVYRSNKVRFELMKRLGYFVTESSEHNAEYSPYFIPHGRSHVAKFDVPLDEYLRRCDCNVDEFARLSEFSRSAEPMHFRKSHEYGSAIIHAIVTGMATVVYGNAPNRGCVRNLPDDAIAEVPTLVDRSGLRPAMVGELPPQLIGYMRPHLTQQELFIRAAMEGRRDHVYQAVMFDPLTSASMTTDAMVEMCDELIAAHGDLLPTLDSKKTLVPNCGKTFAAIDPGTLRASWDAARARAAKDFIAEWSVIGPFKGPARDRISLDLVTSVETDLSNVDTTVAHVGMRWKTLRAHPRTGYVDLARDLAAEEFCVAYAHAILESPTARDVVLRCGSDDGIRIWINGALVHDHEIGRGYKPFADSVEVKLLAGVNRILVKVDNYHGHWGFGVMIPRCE